MNLIQRLKIRTELKRLEARVHESPSPSTFVDLGQVYINLGMHERTLQVAEDGLALFPQSNELRKLKSFAQKKRLADRIDRMRSQLAKARDPQPYHELANLHLELGDLEAVQGVCEECIRRFPDDAEAHLLLARACLLGFYRDLGAREGTAAMEHLEQVVSLGGDESTARRLLAELSWRIGSSTEVLHQVGELERLGFVDKELTAMRDTLGADAGRGGEDMAALFHEVESRGRMARAPVLRELRSLGLGGAASGAGAAGDGAGDGDLHEVRATLAALAEREGVIKATYIRGAKALVKGQIRDSRDPFLRVVRVVARASQRAARRMDLGNFSKGVVDGAFGRLCVCSFGEALAAVQCDVGVDEDALLAELQELVAGSLVGSAGRKS